MHLKIVDNRIYISPPGMRLCQLRRHTVNLRAYARQCRAWNARQPRTFNQD